MTDEMRAREKAICEVAGIKDIGDLSDGFHTFNQLYYQRMILFATIVKQNRDKAWKSLRHESGELCFGGGWFIVGIDTPEGSYTYHYEDNYYSLFDCAELERGKHWDGHTEKDVTRLLSLSALEKQEQDRWIPVTERQPELTHFMYDVTPFSDTVLVTVRNQYGAERLVLGNYEQRKGWDLELLNSTDERFQWHAIAWRPLPKAYQEDKA